MYYKKSSNKLTKVIQEKGNNGIIKRKEKVYLTLLAEKYPTKEHVSREIINLKAI